MSKYQVVWRGPVFDATGYGKASREYVLALHEHGVDVKIETWSWGYPMSEKNKLKGTKWHEMLEKPYASHKQKMLIYHSPPWKIDIAEERKKFAHIILNTVWETTKLPDAWVPMINHFDAVFVPSRHNVEAMTHSGVTIPIALVPHGADTLSFQPQNKKFKLEQIPEGTFNFVSVFEFHHRKNPEALLKAYWEEFTLKDNVALVIKTSWGKKNRKALIQRIDKYKRKLEFGRETAPMFLISRVLRDEEISGLYRLGNVFVLPTRGEGVGLPFMEALSNGTPVIATRWGGQMDFLTDRNSFLVDYDLCSPKASLHKKDIISPYWHELFDGEGQLWAEADIKDLRKQMRKAYNNPSLCKRKGKQGRKDMLEWSWHKAGITLKQAVERVINDHLI
ncbi:glycosyltransferase [Ammoniphilus sp. CFH 90114]|uniref:glycosyltransferase n=1 Tax=Ammoniphilus sp. CFH 90114 TaxID=2493665 RepID=UPI00100F71FB|nr:glycosyltransferase [Ammoniphilus sp. CFH 90114]RXT07130.1 glycosyltransferase [Ammoniphilus sp. CFH 90114]